MRLPKKIILFSILILAVLSVCVYDTYLYERSHRVATIQPTPTATPSPEPSATPTPSGEPSPSPSPTLSPEERAAKYGPCANIPILMFHHIAPEDRAKAGNYASLNVTPEFFELDLEYLRDHSFHAITPSDLVHFFDGSGTLPSHPILLTFDDGYSDFAEFAAPLLAKYQVHATMFIPTGLMDNPPQYMTWSQVSEIEKSGYVYFGNHTWSHHSALGDLATETREITTADTQLKDHGLNIEKVFAYPYGTPSQVDEQVLSSLGYTFAVTTTHGTWQCKGQKYTLPRIRIGNAALNKYGI